jgi:hypothetical protein
MNIKSIAAIAAALIASTAYAGEAKDHKCGAGSCGKKAHTCKEGEKCDMTKEASCSKKDGACSKKEAGCSKKDGGCSKKDASCSKK